jgi:hypothetical protein
VNIATRSFIIYLSLACCPLLVAKSAKDELKARTAAKLPVKIKVSELQVSPQTTFILPDGSIRMSMAILNRGGVSLEATSKYNFVNSDIDYRIKYSYSFGRNALWLSVYDNIDFEDVFAESDFIARRRGGGGGYSRRLGKYYSLGMTLASEEHFIMPLIEDTVKYDKSTLNSGMLRLGYDSRPPVRDPQAGTLHWTSFKQATEKMGGHYRYNRAEFGLNKYIGLKFFPAEEAVLKEKKKRGKKKGAKAKVTEPGNGKNLVIALTGLYGAIPYKLKINSERPAVPYLDRYRLGGFDRLRGYGIGEFVGEDVAFQRVEARLSYRSSEPVGKMLGLYLDRIELVGSYDVGVIGENVYCRKDYLRQMALQSVAYGFRLKLNVKRKVTMILYLMEAMALSDDRDGVFYLSYTIY